MSIKCKIHNRGPGIQIFYDADGNAVEVRRDQTVDVELKEGDYQSLKNLFDDEACGLDLVSTEDAGDDDKKSEAAPPAGAGTGDGGGEDSIERLLADVDAGRLSFPELRSRAKALLGNDFPAGNSPKKDDIVELLQTAQKKRAG